MKAIEIFTQIKDKLECKCYLTGSLALSLYGFYLELTNNTDLDIVIVDPTEGDKKLLQNLQDLSPISQYQNETCQYLKHRIWEVKYQFMLSNIKVDVFIDEKKLHINEDFIYKWQHCYDCSTINIPLNSIFNILNAKKRMNRRKDWSVIYKISQQIMNGFENYIKLTDNCTEKILP
jgi:hypothetical protein